MKKRILFTVFVCFNAFVFAQQNRTTKLFGYQPAPGQFINTPQIGTPGAALRITSSDDDLATLGSFGGSIILGFTHPVVNRPENPWGIDFTIFGNAFPGSSEPGIIWVMKDANQNSLPDDVWYQIAGSEYLNPRTRFHYHLTWKKMADGAAGWFSEDNQSGKLPKNEFHTQPYYPQASLFPYYPADSINFSGTWLDIYPDFTSGKTVLNPLAFGYADNRSRNRYYDLSSPDNPYTPDIQEGAGGDPVDISWAVDSAGRYVDLDRISFIRIVSASTLVTAQLGEVSPEVGFAVATGAADGRNRTDEMVVIHSRPSVMYAGDTLSLSAHYYKKGRPEGKPVLFELADPSSGLLIAGNKLTSLTGGKITIHAFPEAMPWIKAYAQITILTPDSIVVPELKSILSERETISCYPVLTDQFENEIPELKWNVAVSDTSILHAETLDGGFRLTALRKGTGTIRVWTSRFPEKIRMIHISVTENAAPVRVYVTVKKPGMNILPSQWTEVRSNALLNLAAESGSEKNNQGCKSLADAVVTVLHKADAICEMKENSLPGTGMFLYSVEKEGEFTYGWGGKTNPAAFARGWVIRKNGHSFLNGLDKVPISNGDSITIYHVDNILKDWDLSIITATPDTVGQGAWIEIKAQMIKCSYSLLTGITESEPIPLAGQPVFIDNDLAGITDEAGKALLKMAVTPPVVIRAGNDAVMIYRKSLTGSEKINRDTPGIYPNPADDYLRIRGFAGNKLFCSISDGMGRKMLETTVEASGALIPVKHLKSGVYVVVIKSDDHIFRSKFVKR